MSVGTGGVGDGEAGSGPRGTRYGACGAVGGWGWVIHLPRRVDEGSSSTPHGGWMRVCHQHIPRRVDEDGSSTSQGGWMTRGAVPGTGDPRSASDGLMVSPLCYYGRAPCWPAPPHVQGAGGGSGEVRGQRGEREKGEEEKLYGGGNRGGKGARRRGGEQEEREGRKGEVIRTGKEEEGSQAVVTRTVKEGEGRQTRVTRRQQVWPAGRW